MLVLPWPLCPGGGQGLVNRKAAGREVVVHVSRVQAAPLAPGKHW